MKFVELHLDGFGKLVNRAFSFAPGLNLVFGPNEAGKSTLQQALLALLYGFYDEGSITKAKRDLVGAIIPWLPNVRFSGSLVYQLDDGRTFRVRRTFSDRPTTRLETWPGQQDVSSEYNSAPQGRLFFADAQLGMSKAVFENTCIVRQAELVTLESSATAITDTMMRLSASASPDTTTADALAVLDKAVRDEVGTDRTWTKPLAMARKQMERLEASQREAMNSRHELFALIAELNQEEAEAEKLERDLQRLRYLEAAAECLALRMQLDASTEADEEAQRLADEVERWRNWSDFPAQLRDQVIRLDADRARLAEELTERAPRVADVRRHRAELARRTATTECSVAALADARHVPTERQPEMQRLSAQWDSAHAAEQAAKARLGLAKERMVQLKQDLSEEEARMKEIAQLGPMGVAQLEQRWTNAAQAAEQARTRLQRAWGAWNRVGVTDEQFQALAEIARQFQAGTYMVEHPRKGCRPFSGSKTPQGPPPEVVTYFQIKPIRDQWETTRGESLAARKQLAAIEDEIRRCLGLEAGQPVDQAAFGAANQRLTALTRRSSEVEVQRQAVTAAENDVESARNEAKVAEQTLAQALSVLGYTGTDPRVLMRSFEKACERRRQYDQALIELQQLRGEVRLLDQEEQAQVHLEESMLRACNSLRAALAQAGITVAEDELPAAVQQFQERYQYHQQWLRAKEQYEAALARPASGLTQQERVAACKRLGNLESQIQTWQSDHPALAPLLPDHDAHDYRARAREIEASLVSRLARRTQLQASIKSISAAVRHPAELAEEIVATQARIQRLEYLRDVLSLAQDELAAATQEFQKAFAPRLEQVVAEGMSRVTEGRYSQVTIDPSTLAISLLAPERTSPVDASVLSTGTRDLIYLLLRIGVGQLLSRSGEMLPLLLDDPLVQFDQIRQEHALQLLSSLAEETQIILFTKDDDILKWYQEKLIGDEKHKLQLLG